MEDEEKRNVKVVGLTLFCAIMFFGLFWIEELYKPNQQQTEHESCVLCNGSTAYHSPLVVNMATGELCELRVYQPHPIHARELTEEQTGGFMAMMMHAGLVAWRDPDAHTCKTTISKPAGEMDTSHFCRSCRTQLADSKELGFAVVDLYDPNGVHIYKIEDGAEYTIRDYTVMILLKVLRSMFRETFKKENRHCCISDSVWI